MEIFLTANGSVIGYEKKTKPKLVILISRGQGAGWIRMKTKKSEDGTALEVEDADYPGIKEFHLPGSKKNYGYFVTDRGSEIPFLDVKQAMDLGFFDDPESMLKEIFDNQEGRAKGAEVVREKVTDIQSQPAPTINSYQDLEQFARDEIARLKKTCFSKAKIKAIEAALKKASSILQGQDNADLLQSSYQQIARECGLINALYLPRWPLSKQARTNAPTSAIKHLEDNCPGITTSI